MSGDSALEHSPTIGGKRRRPTTGDCDAPATKKSFTDAEIAAELAHSLHIREQRRAEVRAIYLNYGTLLKGSENGSEALAFQGLLDCTNGSLGARRLAARLVPRFLPRFPSHAEQAFRLLSTLYGHGQPLQESRVDCTNGKGAAGSIASQQAGCAAANTAGASDAADDCGSLEGAMRRDALLGLGNVLEAAVRQAERNVPVVMELVLFLMRHLRRLCNTNGGGRSGGGGGDAAGAAATLLPSKTVGAPSPQQPLPVQPPSLVQHETSSAAKGHGLKHRYNRRNAEAAANAEANLGGGRSAQPSPPPPPPSSSAGVPPLPHGARHEVRYGYGKAGGASGSGAAKAVGGGGRDGAEEGAGAACVRIVDLGASADPDSEAGIIRSLLFRAFCLFPRVVLAACFQPFRLPPKQRGPEDCQACELLLDLLLLRAVPGDVAIATTEEPLVASAPTGSATEAMEEGGSASADGAGVVKRGGREGNATDGPADGGSAAVRGPGPGPGSADGQAGSGGCLAARVLAHLPETQTWLRQLAAAMAQGKTQHTLPCSIQVQLERLLQYCTAVTVPPAAAVAGKVSPRASPQGAMAMSSGAAAGAAASANPTPARQGAAEKPDGGTNAAATAAQSMVGSDDNSRSVPMDLDHSISTAVRPEVSGAATAAATAGAAAAGAAAMAAGLAGPPDTAATSAPPPPLPQHPYSPHHHHHPQHDATAAAAALGPVMAAAATGLAPLVSAAAPQPPLPPPPPPPLPALLPSYHTSGSSGLRGGPVCRAEACLYIGGLPPGMTEAALVLDFSRLGNVESVHPFDQQQVLQQHPVHGGALGVPQAPLGEEVYVVFVSLRDAAMCYEAVARTCRFGGSRPLVVEFCSAFPADSPAARRCVAAAAAAAAAGSGAGSTASEFVWVSLSAGAGVTPEAVVAALQATSLPVPQQILQVAGRAPGMLLHMASAAIVPQVTACLQAHFTLPALPPPPPGGAVAAAATAAATGAGTAGLPPPPPLLPTVGGAPPLGPSAAPPVAGVHYSTPLHMQQAGSAAAALGADPPPLNCRTIWIGQLHESVRDEELLSACRHHGGDVVGHRILRGSHCAFVDFASQAGAEAAKRALHGARLGPQHIRVEWKLDSGPPPRAPLTLRHGGTPLSSATPSTPISGLYGLGSGGPTLATPASGPQGMGLLGAVGGQGLLQQSSAPAGLGLLGQAMTPQAVAAANVAAAAAAAAARGAFPGGRSGADRWAPVVIPPPAPVSTSATPTSAGAAVGSSAGGQSGVGPGFLATGPLPMQGTQGMQQQQQQAPHLQVGPFGTGVMNPAVAAAARQAAPMLLPHQHLVAGLSGGGGGGVVRPHGMGAVAPQQGAGGFGAQQQQHLHPHPDPHPHPHAAAAAVVAFAGSGGGGGGGALPHAPLLSSQAPHIGHGHLLPGGGYPGPPPLQPQQQLVQQQQQGSLALLGHASTAIPLHQPHGLGVGGPSQQQQPQVHHSHSHPQGQPQQQRPNEWPPPPPPSHGHVHGHGVGGGSHLTSSPGLPGGLTQPQRFEPGSATGPPLPNSPPLPPEAMAAAGAGSGGGGGTAPAAGSTPPPPLPHAHSQQQQQHGVMSQPHPHMQQHGQQMAAHPHANHSYLQQQLPLPPPQQYPQQQQYPPMQHSPQQQQQQQQQQPPPAGGLQLVTWQGGLAKSGMHMCTLLCTTGGASASSGATPGEREPVTWPATLDVKLRVDLSYVVHSLYSHTAPHARAMRRLVPAGGPEQRSKLSEFLSYLADKNRAGVIKLEAAAGLPPRTLYLVPPSEQVCAALGAEWSTREPFLLALVVPTAGGTVGGTKG